LEKMGALQFGNGRSLRSLLSTKDPEVEEAVIVEAAEEVTAVVAEEDFKEHKEKDFKAQDRQR